MFKVYINGTGDANLLFDVSKGIDLVEPVLTLNDGEPDTFECTVLPDNPNYSETELFKARITIDEEETIDGVTTTEGRFRGRIISVKTDMYGRRTIKCEGALAYLDDVSFDRLEVGTLVSTTFSFALIDALDALNTYLGDSDRAVTTNLTSLTLTKRYWSAYVNPDYSLLDVLKMIAEDNDMHLWAAYKSASYEAQGNTDLVYIRMLAHDSLPSATQEITYGDNMVSCNITETIRNSFCTRCTAVTDGTNTHETVDTTNNVRGSSTPMIDYYGIKEVSKVYNTDDTTELNYKATTYVNRYAKEGYEIDVQAVDSHYLDSSVAKFKMRTLVNVVHPSLGLNETVPVKSIVYHLTAPKSNVVRCTKTGSKKLTDQVKGVTTL